MLSVCVVSGCAPPFSITDDACSNQTLAAAETCDITIEFAPPEIDVFDSSFDIPSNDPDEASITVDVSGSGVAEQQQSGRQSEGGSALDPGLLIGLGALGAARKRRRRANT